MTLDPDVWGPKFWFVLHTIAIMYPKRPNEAIRKKYYELVQNIPLYLPSAPLGDIFAGLLDTYPVTPYLDTQESFIKWVHFIRNKVNIQVGKPEIDMEDFIKEYQDNYIPKQVVKKKDTKMRHNIAMVGVMASLIVVIFALYRK